MVVGLPLEEGRRVAGRDQKKRNRLTARAPPFARAGVSLVRGRGGERHRLWREQQASGDQCHCRAAGGVMITWVVVVGIFVVLVRRVRSGDSVVRARVEVVWDENEVQRDGEDESDTGGQRRQDPAAPVSPRAHFHAVCHRSSLPIKPRSTIPELELSANESHPFLGCDISRLMDLSRVRCGLLGGS